LKQVVAAPEETREVSPGYAQAFHFQFIC